MAGVKPTVELPGVTLYLGNCVEILPQLEADSINAVVTD